VTPPALPKPAASNPAGDLLCLSHLRWNFVFQRPQHLMTRFARHRRVFFVEEPLFDAREPSMALSVHDGVHVAVPHLPRGIDAAASLAQQRALLQHLVARQQITQPVLWLYTPMAHALVRDLPASAVVYDCMDELSGFAFAPPDLAARERELLARADLVFTGGQSLYEAKRDRHSRVFPFPSSVDVKHFAQARWLAGEPADQQAIPRPRLGFCGVLDERMNLRLLGEIAAQRPDWHFVLIGPVVKIEQDALPRGPNLHYLGMKPYDELPRYLAGWDVAMLPFALNAATRYISPTKTPEYLAAGRPVVSTSIRDVVRPYGERGMAQIADSPGEWVAAIEVALRGWSPAQRREIERYLATLSWDRTQAAMEALVDEVVTPATASVRVRRSAPDDPRPMEVPAPPAS
jgi:glycosyltransferase involved in cell wall biosynthesis